MKPCPLARPHDALDGVYGWCPCHGLGPAWAVRRVDKEQGMEIKEVDGIPTVEGYTVIPTPEMWEGYKALLDARGYERDGGPYQFRHYGTPAHYPCIVETQLEYNPEGPYSCDHEFTYLSELERQAAILRAVQAELDAQQAAGAGGEG